MKKHLVKNIMSLCLAVLLACLFTGCQQRVVLTPGDEDLVVLNGCVISACNYLAVVKTQHSLERQFWAKILLVRFANHPAGHAYTVWETEGNIYGYDRNSGSFQLPVYTKDARTIAIVLAQQLSKVLGEPLSVSNADFIQSNEAELFNYSSLEVAPAVPHIATAFQAVSLVQP